MNPDKAPSFSLGAVSDLLISLQATLKFSRLYPLQHPLLTGAVNRLKDNINKFFSANSILRLRLKRQQIYTSGKLLNRGDELLETLALAIYRLGIRELSFYQGVSEEDLLKFIVVVNMDANLLVEKGGIENIWEGNKFDYIKINETLHQEVFRIGAWGQVQREAQPANSKLGEVVLLADFLGGQEKNLARDGYKLLGELLANPENMAGMLQALARSELNDKGGQEAVPEELVQEYVIRAFGKLVNLIQQQPAEQKKNFYHQLAASTQHFAPGLKNKLLKEIGNEALKNEASGELLAELPSRELNTILQEKQASGSKEEDMLAIISRLPVSNKAKNELLSQLNIGTQFVIPEQVKPEEPEKTEQVALSPLELAEIHYQLPPNISNILAELSSYNEGELKEIEKLIRSTEKNEVEETVFAVLSELMNQETEENKFQRLAGGIERRVRRYLDADVYDWPVAYLQKIRDRSQDTTGPAAVRNCLQEMMVHLGEKEIIQKLLDSIRKLDKDEAGYAMITNYLFILPGESVPHLVDALAVEELLAIRRLLCQILSEVGKQGLGYLWEKLEDPDWHLVRNITMILGMINDERSFTPLVNLLKHDNMRVRMEVIKSLGSSGNPRVLEWLLLGLKDKNMQVRQHTVEWLGNLQDKRAIPTLVRLVKERDLFGVHTALKKEAIMALGVLRAQEAKPLLEKMTKKSWLDFIRSRQSLRDEAKKSLELILGAKKHD